MEINDVFVERFLALMDVEPRARSSRHTYLSDCEPANSQQLGYAGVSGSSAWNLIGALTIACALPLKVALESKTTLT